MPVIGCCKLCNQLILHSWNRESAKNGTIPIPGARDLEKKIKEKLEKESKVAQRPLILFQASTHLPIVLFVLSTYSECV